MGYYAIQHRECEFFSPVLGKEEHRELFSMVEKKFFYEYPDIYPEYLTVLLLKESTALWMEQSEAYELSKLLLPFISDSYRRETLYQKYMTEEDRKRYQERKEWLKEQKKRIDHWKTEKNIKQQFNQILRENRKTDKEIQSIYEFYKNGRYSYGHKKLYCKIVSSYLKDNFTGTAKKLMAKKEALYLLKLAENDDRKNLKAHEYLQGNEKCSNSPEPDRKERGRFLYECGQTGKSAGTFQSDGGVK